MCNQRLALPLSRKFSETAGYLTQMLMSFVHVIEDLERLLYKRNVRFCNFGRGKCAIDMMLVLGVVVLLS